MKKSAIILISILMMTASALEPVAGSDDPVRGPLLTTAPFLGKKLADFGRWLNLGENQAIFLSSPREG